MVLLNIFSSLYLELDKVCSRLMVVVGGMLSQVRHLLSHILHLSRNSNIMVLTEPNLGGYRYGLVANVLFIVFKVEINCVAGCWSWLRCYHK
jgi:hypothetical protein